MSEPIIQAKESLLRNGDFKDLLNHWIDKGTVAIQNEFYESEFIPFMHVGVGASARQEVVVPKKADASASYELTFLCELRPGFDWSGESGWLCILSGSDVLMNTELKAGDSRSLEQDQARLAAGQPLEFKPIRYRQSLDQLAFDSGDVLTFEVRGVPSNPSDRRTGVLITWIDLQLKLEPLKLQAMRLDEQDLVPDRKLYLCLGASLGNGLDDPLYMQHYLSFEPRDGNAWQGTKMALTVRDNPLEAIMTAPDWGVDQTLTVPWSLDCPWMAEDKTYEFSIILFNQYDAEPYPIEVSLGHHRLAFGDEQKATFYPVLEYAQSVRLGVQIVSHYTRQALDGRTVNWTSAAQGVLGAGVTDEQGWVFFDFEPKTAGDVVITAWVDSPYYATGKVTYDFAVKVLATDPWKALRAVIGTQETAWEATGYPNRGSNHPVIVRLPADSPLLGAALSLHWSGEGHEQLGVTVNPPLEAPLPFNGGDVLWTLTSEDRLDGRFELSLQCSKLLLPSPGKPMSLARNRLRVGEVREANKFPIVDEEESVLLRVQAIHYLTAGDGDPVSNALVEWVTPDGDAVHDVTGAGGWTSLLYTPKSTGDKTVTAYLKAHPDDTAVEQDFTVKPVATSPWKGEVEIRLDAVKVESPLGMLCRRGQTHALTVVPKAGSDWIGRNISLHWRGNDPAIGLTPEDLTSPKTLLAGGVEWKLVSNKNDSSSGLFELELRLAGLASVRELSGRLLSEDLTEEVALMLDQIHAELDARNLYPCLGAVHRFKVLPNALSPLVGLDASLKWSGAPADSLGATVEPTLDRPQVLSDGGVNWTLGFTASTAPGEFALTLALPQLKFEAIAKPMTLAHNRVRIEAWRGAAVDPVIGQAPAWMWVQVYSHYTNRPVDQAPVTWTGDTGPRDIQTTVDGWSGFDFAPKIAGDQLVTASVLSRYDNYPSTQPMTVEALASDPWEEVLVSFDKQPPQPLGTHTFFPRRNTQHWLDVTAPAGSALFNKDLVLGMTGTGPAELGMRFEEPRLGEPWLFPSAGQTYSFKTGDLKDASFGLRFSSARLASLSPVNAMSLGQGEQVLKIAERQRSHQTLLWGTEVSEQITVISAISGRPMVGVTVTWRSPDLGVKQSTSNFYGVAKIAFVPTTPGPLELTASVGGELHSDSVSLPFFLNEPRKIDSLTSPQPGGPEGAWVSATVNVVSALTGEPLQGVEVEWKYPDRILESTYTDENGNAEVRFRLAGIRRTWLQAAVRGGYAGWDAQFLEFELVPVNE